MGRRIGPKTWDRTVEFFGDLWAVRECPECPETVVGCCVRNCVINSMLVCMRPGIAMKIGSTKRNRCRKCGLPVDSPLTLFWNCKNSPGFVINGLKLSMCFGMKLYVLCDLIWCGVEINRLMLNED